MVEAVIPSALLSSRAPYCHPERSRGYGLRQDIIDHTDGAIALEAGNLYRIIRRLEADGVVEECGHRPASDSDDEWRRYYRLTPFGKRVLAAELERVRAIVRLGEARRIIAPLPA
jgi:DNA-binding PadR family transcriptional regulator